jgi:ribulose-phosphate 3-epimerase
MSFKLAPSILSADFGNLQKDIEMINKSEADWFHIDVMDGVFVPNISFGFPVIKSVQKHATKPLDVHLMIKDCDPYIKQFVEHGAWNITIHYEACMHLHRSIQNIKNNSCRAGVALNPHTPISLLNDIINELDLVLIMSVNPGFGGQKFIQNTYQKVEELRNLIIRKNSSALIEVDGGVDLTNYKKLLNAGANALVAGNAVFATPNPIETIEKFKQ